MDASLFIMLVAAVLIGVLTGITGIGGFLLTPVLISAGGMGVHEAVATSMFSFIFTGSLGTLAHLRHGSIDWRIIRWLIAGILPGAFIGGRVTVAVPAAALTVVLAAFLLASGGYALRLARSADSRALVKPRPRTLAALGAVVGAGSAVTGTGGPAILGPMLTVLGWPALAILGMSKAILVPVASTATIGYALGATVHVALGTSLGLTASVGMLSGTMVAHRLPAAALRRLVALAFIAAGLYMLGNARLG